MFFNKIDTFEVHIWIQIKSIHLLSPNQILLLTKYNFKNLRLSMSTKAKNKQDKTPHYVFSFQVYSSIDYAT